MPAIGEVVELANGDVGVIGEALPSDQWRVYFPEGRVDVLADAIAETLSSPSFGVGATVSVWPHQGAIKSLGQGAFSSAFSAAFGGGSGEVVVTVSRSEHIPGVGTPQWETDVVVPLWRLIRDNDPRLQRDL